MYSYPFGALNNSFFLYLFLFLSHPYMVYRVNYGLSSSSSLVATSFQKISFKIETLDPHIFLTPISLKLDTDNFLVWRQQVTLTLHIMDLLHFLEGSCIPSHLIIVEGSSTSSINPKYSTYDRQYQSILA